LRDLLRSVLDVIMELLPVTSGIIFLLDPTRAQLTLGSHRGVPAAYTDRMQSFPISGSACEEVVRYGQPTLRPLIEERGESELLHHGLESCAYLPLLAGGTVVGAMGLYGDMMLYKEIDMARLMPLGNQVGFAIANVRLYEDSQIERRKLNTVINSIAEGVVLCDSEGRLVLANEAAMELLSLEAVPYDQPLSEMSDFYGIRDLEGQSLPVEQLPMARALSGETFHDYRVLIHGVSGHNSVMSFSGAPAGTDTIEGAVVIFRDITSNQRLERAKDEFLAIAAHELRSPLAAVRSYAEMLLRRERQRNEQDSRDVRGLSILSQQVTHMLRMVDNLLDVSRLDAGQLDLQLQRINLVSLATQVLDQQRPAAPEHNLVLETTQPELWVECDSMRVRQVLTNLVSNAIKYSPPQTSIVVNLTTRMAVALDSTERTDQGQPLSIELGQSSRLDSAELQPPGTREALVSVADQGGGIDSDKQARLFERFYRIRSRRAEGLGLGLYLSREFVLMHGGHIWVESTEGKGSTFCFTLPMREE
jgi:two-component system phosphate regulon sensor histidine kinase PhoR